MIFFSHLKRIMSLKIFQTLATYDMLQLAIELQLIFPTTFVITKKNATFASTNVAFFLF